jgi:hypothetical protein
MILFSQQLLYASDQIIEVYEPGQVLKSRTSGSDTFTITQKMGIYEVHLVGPGGSSATAVAYYSTSNHSGCWSQPGAGSGGVFIGEVLLAGGSYTVSVPIPHNAYCKKAVQNCSASTSTASSAYFKLTSSSSNLITCGAGGHASASASQTSTAASGSSYTSSAGSGGSCSYDNNILVTSINIGRGNGGTSYARFSDANSKNTVLRNVAGATGVSYTTATGGDSSRGYAVYAQASESISDSQPTTERYTTPSEANYGYFKLIYKRLPT